MIPTTNITYGEIQAFDWMAALRHLSTEQLNEYSTEQSLDFLDTGNTASRLMYHIFWVEREFRMFTKELQQIIKGAI